MTTTIDVEHLLSPDQLAVEIGNQWTEWRMLRQNWTDQTKEIRNYVYATDTTSTANAILPWSNRLLTTYMQTTQQPCSPRLTGYVGQPPAWKMLSSIRPSVSRDT